MTKLKKYQASRASVVLLLLLAGCAAPYWTLSYAPLPECAPTVYVEGVFNCGGVMAEGCTFSYPPTCAQSIVMRGPGVECRESHEKAHRDGWWHEPGWKLARQDCGPTTGEIK